MALINIAGDGDAAANDDVTKRTEQILLFGSGLGSSISYIATLSSLVYFKNIYGPDSYVDLNLAVYLPLLPVSLLQAKYDQYYDSVYQTRKTFLFRGVIAFALIFWGTIDMLLGFSAATEEEDECDGDGDGDDHNTSRSTLTALILNATLQGTGGAVLYGTLNQLASFLGTTDEECRTSKAAISAGVQASALLVLGISVLSGFGITNNGHCFSKFLTSVLAMQVVCLFMFLWLLLKRSSVTASMVRRDSTLQLNDDSSSWAPAPLNETTSEEEEEEVSHHLHQDDDDDDVQLQLQESLLLNEINHHQSSNNDRDYNNNTDSTIPVISYKEIWNHSKFCCCILVGTLIPSFLVGSWFTHVQTEWIRLPQILFYTRIAADFLGRLATIYIPPTNLPCLTWTCLLRLVPVSFFFAMNHRSTLNTIKIDRDMVSIGLVTIIAFLSGYLVTGCYQTAPQCLPEELQQSGSNLTKQASLLTVAFSIAAILGLLSSFALVAIGY